MRWIWATLGYRIHRISQIPHAISRGGASADPQAPKVPSGNTRKPPQRARIATHGKAGQLPHEPATGAPDGARRGAPGRETPADASFATSTTCFAYLCEMRGLPRGYPVPAAVPGPPRLPRGMF